MAGYLPIGVFNVVYTKCTELQNAKKNFKSLRMFKLKELFPYPDDPCTMLHTACFCSRFPAMVWLYNLIENSTSGHEGSLTSWGGKRDRTTWLCSFWIARSRQVITHRFIKNWTSTRTDSERLLLKICSPISEFDFMKTLIPTTLKTVNSWQFPPLKIRTLAPLDTDGYLSMIPGISIWNEVY